MNVYFFYLFSWLLKKESKYKRKRHKMHKTIKLTTAPNKELYKRIPIRLNSGSKLSIKSVPTDKINRQLSILKSVCLHPITVAPPPPPPPLVFEP